MTPIRHQLGWTRRRGAGGMRGVPAMLVELCCTTTLISVMTIPQDADIGVHRLDRKRRLRRAAMLGTHCGVVRGERLRFLTPVKVVMQEGCSAIAANAGAPKLFLSFVNSLAFD